MLDDSQLATYAQGFAAALRVIGPASQGQVVGRMLRVLRLDVRDAESVIAYALANGILEVDGDLLRAVKGYGAASGTLSP
jgi:hypothetical protein